MNIDPYLLMRTLDILERLRLAEAGTYHRLEAEVQAKSVTAEILKILKDGEYDNNYH